MNLQFDMSLMYSDLCLVPILCIWTHAVHAIQRYMCTITWSTTSTCYTTPQTRFLLLDRTHAHKLSHTQDFYWHCSPIRLDFERPSERYVVLILQTVIGEFSKQMCWRSDKYSISWTWTKAGRREWWVATSINCAKAPHFRGSPCYTLQFNPLEVANARALLCIALQGPLSYTQQCNPLGDG